MKEEVRVWWEELAEWYAVRANDFENLKTFTCDDLAEELQFGDTEGEFFIYWPDNLGEFFTHWEECGGTTFYGKPDGAFPCDEWDKNYDCVQEKRAQLCLWMVRVIEAYLEDESVMPWEVK